MQKRRNWKLNPESLKLNRVQSFGLTQMPWNRTLTWNFTLRRREASKCKVKGQRGKVPIIIWIRIIWKRVFEARKREDSSLDRETWRFRNNLIVKKNRIDSNPATKGLNRWKYQIKAIINNRRTNKGKKGSKRKDNLRRKEVYVF
jgi:hypothetical protein